MAPSEETVIGCCNVCQVSSTLRCSACGLVLYCAREHQLKDWSSHKSTCSMVKRIKVEPDPPETAQGTLTPSKYVVKAKVDLVHKLKNRKRPVMRLKPLLIVPVLPEAEDLAQYARQCPNTATVPRALIPCLGCCQLTAFSMTLIDPDRGPCFGKCSRCTWPVHNEACQTNKHHLDECQFFQERGIKVGNYKELPNNFMCLGILRAVLMKLKGKAEYTSLMNMPVEVQRTQTEFVIPSYVADAKEVEDKVKAFIYGKCRITRKEISESELSRLFLVVKNNMLPSPQAFDYHKAFANFVFHGFQGRVLSHSCLPNCYVDVDVASLAGSVYILRDIKAGEKLEINYDGRVEFLRGLSMISRNIYLQNSLGCAPCTCPMCSDPTENSSYFSAIRCTNKNLKPPCTGYLLPIKPTSWAQNALWTCTNKANCQQKMTMLEVEERVILLQRKLKTVVPENLPAFYGIVTEFESKILHPNHYRILTGYMMLATQIINRMNNVFQYVKHDGSKEIVPESFVHHKTENPRYLEVFERLLRILHLVQPGENRMHVIILFYASLLRLSQMAEEFRLAQSTEEMAVLVAERNAELMQITLDFNTTTVGYMGNTYGAYHPDQILAKHQFLLRTYCGCLRKSLEPLIASPHCPPWIFNSPFQGIIGRKWDELIKQDHISEICFFHNPSWA